MDPISRLDFQKIAVEEVATEKNYPPPFSLRLTHEERQTPQREIEAQRQTAWDELIRVREDGARSTITLCSQKLGNETDISQ